MKKLPTLVFLSFSTLFLLSALGCQKDPPEAILPTEVELGASVVYLNGEEINFITEILYDSINRVMSYGFGESLNQGQLVNSLGFGRLPYSTGEFSLTTENILFKKARTSFHQTVSEDLDGYEYKLIDADEGFFNVEYLDTINLEVKGRFKAKFKRTAKNGVDGGLSKYLTFQGVFYENYTFK